MRRVVVLLLTIAVAVAARAGTQLGKLSTSDPVQAGRIVRNGVPSSCATDKACPGVFDSFPRHYRAFPVMNASTRSVCLSFQSSLGGVLLSLYQDSFNPNDLCDKYLADL